jgi:GntR family transcriptional regulator, transcriptional repressor for pyruvate dehydrogenase complex
MWSNFVVDAVSVADRLTTEIELRIADGRLRPGDRIPAERELAQELNVSRASLRQALHELEMRGLIDRRPGRGTVVLEQPEGEFRRALAQSVSPQLGDVDNVMDLRMVVEPPVAARAAKRRRSADLKRLHAIQAQMEQTRDLQSVAELDVAFHREIAGSTHNPLLARLLEVTSEWMGPSRGAAVQMPRRYEASMRAHRLILDAIEARDEAAAHDAMLSHLQTVRENIVAVLGSPRSASSSATAAE